MVLSSSQSREISEFLELHRTGRLTDAIVLISCSKSKLSRVAPVKDLYSSNLFQKSIRIANQLGLRHLVLSAKHGLVSPNCVISPYNFSISDLSNIEKQQWGDEVAGRLNYLGKSKQSLIFLASKHYCDPILTRLSKKFEPWTPLHGLSIGKMGEWLGTLTRALEREAKLRELYTTLEAAASRVGFHTLKEVIADHRLPNSGIYFFFDNDEPTKFSHALPRLVRIGTHGVSHGSKSKLRTRLRTHLGTAHGTGNHRGSVFRLHVGAALIAQRGLGKKYPHWAKGQSAASTIRIGEVDLEKSVSAYIGSLRVVYLEIDDIPGKTSLRAFVEKNAIALLTERNVFIESATANWLGRFSPNPVVRDSGLWNVQHVGSDCDFLFLQTLKSVATRGEELRF